MAAPAVEPGSAESFLLLTCLARSRLLEPSLALALGSLSSAHRLEEQLWDALVRVRAGPARRTALMAAARAGNVGRVQWLLKRSAPVNVHCVAANELVEHEHDGTGEYNGQVSVVLTSALSLAEDGEHAEAATALRHAGALPLVALAALDAALLRCASTMMYQGVPISPGASTDSVRALLHEGADVEARSTRPFETLCTPLHAACRAGRADIVATLLAAGACTESRDIAGSTVLFTAVMASSDRNRVDIISALLAAGADAKVKNKFFCFGSLACKMFSCHWQEGAGYGQFGLGPLLDLCAHGAGDGRGPFWQPLHVAAFKGDAGAVCALLSEGADARAVDAFFQKKPRDFAAARAHDVVAELLREAETAAEAKACR